MSMTEDWIGVTLIILAALLVAGLLYRLWRGVSRRLLAAQRADWGRPALNHLDGLNRIFCRQFHRLQHDPLPLPKTGAAIVVANHISGLDPLVMIAACDRPLRFLIAREQFERPWLTPLFRAIGGIPVDRSASPRQALAAALEALRAGEVVALFPQGRIHLNHEPPAKLKRGVHYLAEASGAPIYPLCINGVRGEGLTVAALWRRSRVRITSFPPLHGQIQDADTLLQTLGALLSCKSN